MLPALRTLASAKLAWFRIATTLAPGAVATTHTRHTKDRAGNPLVQQVVRQPKYVVSNGALVTGEVLLKLALANVRRLTATPGLWSPQVLTDAAAPELPALFTSGRELSQQRRVTDRTIRTHVAELKACGFITRYQFRGREHAYCVWINPDFVFETAPSAEKNGAPKPAESNLHGKNLPPKEVLEALEAPKSTISAVEKLVTYREPAAARKTGSPLTRIAGLQRGSEPGTEGQKSGAGGAGAARAAQFYQQAEARGTGAKWAQAKRYVEWVWSLAKNLIYRKFVFNEEAERKAKNAIWYGVFYGFTQGEPADWKNWLPGIQRRIELAAAWFERNPSAYPSAPYAEVLAGCGYFDAGNTKGFARTEAWWRTEQARQQQGALERALDEAIAELAQRRRLDAGQRRVQASQRARQKSAGELHRFHHTNLRRMGGDEALRRFAARLQAEHLLTLPN